MERAAGQNHRTLIGLRGLHPEVRRAAEAALELAQEGGLEVRITSSFRSLEEQAILRRRFEMCVAAGRFPSPPDCKYPANRAGDSAHNFGLAFDSVLNRGEQREWDAIREAVGFRVPSNDLIHAEVPGWRDLKNQEIQWINA